MTKELITVKEYCRRKKISDTATRKQINTGKINSLIIDNITYIVIETDTKEKQKNSLKLKNKEIQNLKNQLHHYEDQKERIIKLENKIDTLEEKLELERDKKDKIYENIFADVAKNRLSYKG